MYPIEEFLNRTERVYLLMAPTPLHTLAGFSEYEEGKIYY